VAIQSTLPSGPGQRNRKIFALARELKAVAELARADFDALRPIIREWHRQALPYIRTKAWEETWADFVVGWERVRCPAGQNSIAHAYQRALRAELPAVARQYNTPDLQLLVSLCRELQHDAGSDRFFLDQLTAARLLGTHQGTISRWLRMLVADGVLELVSRGSRATQQANTYQYKGG
jgi:hypothetical protein